MELNKVYFGLFLLIPHVHWRTPVEGEKQYKVQAQMCNLSLVIRLSAHGIRVIWAREKDANIKTVAHIMS